MVIHILWVCWPLGASFLLLVCLGVENPRKEMSQPEATEHQQTQSIARKLDEDATIEDFKAIHAELLAARSFALQAMNSLQVSHACHTSVTVVGCHVHVLRRLKK